MDSSQNASPLPFAAQAEKLRDWLFAAAYPLWWQVGADRRRGGYHERIDLHGRPVILPRRSRVAARQAFCYGEAGRLGWRGPWRDAGKHALDDLRERFVRADGTVVAAVGPDGRVVDAAFDLYNQAFALLAYACGHGMIDPAGDWRSRACVLRDTLKREFAHPAGGFREDREGRTAPLRANPHMHLLEAALAWLEIDDDPTWRAMADAIVALCLDRFIDPASGGLREFFAADWTALRGSKGEAFKGEVFDGEVLEPGHHYEWAFLLDRWAKLTGRDRPAAAAQLIAFADAHGLDRKRGVVVNGIRLDGSVCDPIARLWPQTERLRAYVIDRRADNDARLHEAIASLWRYLDTPVPGLWHENLGADGRFLTEAAPATSLYHIVGAVKELCAAFAPVRKPAHE
jgi:mannose/cellobiose epimerase-like protein (N-acyl-D-glucosamine 2-epimerase family)